MFKDISISRATVASAYNIKLFECMYLLHIVSVLNYKYILLIKMFVKQNQIKAAKYLLYISIKYKK